MNDVVVCGMYDPVREFHDALDQAMGTTSPTMHDYFFFHVAKGVVVLAVAISEAGYPVQAITMAPPSSVKNIDGDALTSTIEITFGDGKEKTSKLVMHASCPVVFNDIARSRVSIGAPEGRIFRDFGTFTPFTPANPDEWLMKDCRQGIDPPRALPRVLEWVEKLMTDVDPSAYTGFKGFTLRAPTRCERPTAHKPDSFRR